MTNTGDADFRPIWAHLLAPTCNSNMQSQHVSGTAGNSSDYSLLCYWIFYIAIQFVYGLKKICGKTSTTWINCEPWNSLENIIYMCPFHYVVHHTSIFSTSCLQIHVPWAARKNSGIFQCTLSGLPYPHLRATLLGTLSPTSTLAHRLVVIYQASSRLARNPK